MLLQNDFFSSLLVNLAALATAQGDTTTAAAYQKRAESIHQKNVGFSHLATTTLPLPVKAVLPGKGDNGLMTNSRIGDWVSYEGSHGILSEKKEVVRTTPVVAIVQTYSWDSKKNEWMGGLEAIIGMAATVRQLWHVSEGDLKPEKMKIKDKQMDIACTVIPGDAEHKQCKLCIAREIPVGGLAKVECDGQVIQRAVDYGRAQ